MMAREHRFGAYQCYGAVLDDDFMCAVPKGTLACELALFFALACPASAFGVALLGDATDIDVRCARFAQFRAHIHKRVVGVMCTFDPSLLCSDDRDTVDANTTQLRWSNWRNRLFLYNERRDARRLSALTQAQVCAPGLDCLVAFVHVDERTIDGRARWFASLVAFAPTSSVDALRLCRDEVGTSVSIEQLLPNSKLSQLGSAEVQLVRKLQPLRAPLLCDVLDTEQRLASLSVDAIAPTAFVRRLLSACIRWHCVHAAHRRAELDKNMHGATMRFFRLPPRPTARELDTLLVDDDVVELARRSALCTGAHVPNIRDTLLGADDALAQIELALACSAERRVKRFVALQLCDMYTYVCKHELKARTSLAHRLEFAARFMRTFFGVVRFEVVDNGVSFDAFRRPSPEATALLPGCEMLATRRARLEHGRVWLCAELLVELAPRLFMCHLDRIVRTRVTNLGERTFVVDPLTAYRTEVPVSGKFYAESRFARPTGATDARSCALDDIALGTRLCGGVRLRTLELPSRVGLVRSAEQLAQLSNSRFVVRSRRRGELSVPAHVVSLVTLPRSELGADMSRDELSQSILRRSGAIRSNCTDSNHVPAGDDADGEGGDAFSASKRLQHDVEFKEWLRERNAAEARLRAADKPSLFDDCNSGDTDAATSSAMAAPDIEDLCINLYHNGAYPLCVLDEERKLVEEGKHARDEGRTIVDPFLRSLRLPTLGAPEVTLHMLRNVEPRDFNEKYARHVRHQADYCDKKQRQSFAKHVENGKTPDEARRAASCFPACSTKQRNKTGAHQCPYANVTPKKGASELRAKLLANGTPMTHVEGIVSAACNGRMGKACMRQFVATRRSVAGKCAPPFPTDDIQIGNAREYTILAGVHLARTIEQQFELVQLDSAKAGAQ